MRHFNILLILSVVVFVVSCKTPTDISYFQDVEEGNTALLSSNGEIRIQSGDQLSIYVKTRDAQISSLFNLYSSGSVGGSSSGGMSGGMGGGNSTMGYTVDERGYIEFPELGKVFVKNKTRLEVAEHIKYDIESRNLAKNVVVTVGFINMYYTVLGELGSGRKEIKKDRTTILEAIADAGDLTIDGIRSNILVMRKDGDEMRYYRVNLLNAEKLYNNPAYYIQQDDVIYVEPNDKKKRSSTNEGNNPFTISFWMGMFTFAVGVLNLIF